VEQRPGRGTHSYGTRGLGKSTPLGSADTLGVSKWATRWEGPTQERSAPLALASLGSGPDRPLIGLFKSSTGTLGIWDGQHEARATGPIGATVSLLL